MKRRLNNHSSSRASEAGPSTNVQKKQTKRQIAAQAAMAPPPATSTPAPEPAPTTAPSTASTGSTTRTLQTRIIAQEPSQENGSEEGQGSSGLQAPLPAAFRNKVKKEIRNKILNVTEDQDEGQEESETETEAKLELLETQRKLLVLQIKLAKVKKEKQVKIMRRTTDELALTMRDSLATGINNIEEEYEATEARLWAELDSREVELINLDDSQDQDEMAAIAAFSHEAGLDEDAEDEVVDNEEDMDLDASRMEPANRARK